MVFWNPHASPPDAAPDGPLIRASYGAAGLATPGFPARCRPPLLRRAPLRPAVLGAALDAQMQPSTACSVAHGAWGDRMQRPACQPGCLGRLHRELRRTAASFCQKMVDVAVHHQGSEWRPPAVPQHPCSLAVPAPARLQPAAPRQRSPGHREGGRCRGPAGRRRPATALAAPALRRQPYAAAAWRVQEPLPPAGRRRRQSVSSLPARGGAPPGLAALLGRGQAQQPHAAAAGAAGGQPGGQSSPARPAAWFRRTPSPALAHRDKYSGRACFSRVSSALMWRYCCECARLL